jgi:hypothetical protein
MPGLTIFPFAFEDTISLGKYILIILEIFKINSRFVFVDGQLVTLLKGDQKKT